MSSIDDLIQRFTLFDTINYTPNEKRALSLNPKNLELLNSLSRCKGEMNPNDKAEIRNLRYYQCLIKSICLDSFSGFNKCAQKVKEAKLGNMHDCRENFNQLHSCLDQSIKSYQYELMDADDY